jgi:hypothetical protein
MVLALPSGASAISVQFTVNPRYDYARDFKEGLAPVEKNGVWGYIDMTGKEEIPFNYKYAYSFSEGLAAVKSLNGKWGYIDKTRKEVIAFQYERADSFSDGWATVEKD